MRNGEDAMTEPPFDFPTLERLGARTRHFDAGEKIFLAEEPANTMFIVRSGRVDVITYGTVLENVQAGGMFGELALIDDGDRSAAAMAAEPTEAVAIDKATFLKLVREDPEFALRVMRVLAARIRRMNDQI
jgi:CRP/FNR family transcriptional regulator, cyclic AMP receptor protein